LAAFLVGLASLALCPPVGLVAIALGVVEVRRARDVPGRPGRALAVGGIVAGVVAVLMAVSLVWFYDAAISPAGTTVTDISTDEADGTCTRQRVLQDPDC
jgi:hypothetical protein